MNRWPRLPLIPFWTVPAFIVTYVFVESLVPIMVTVSLLRYPDMTPTVLELLWEDALTGSEVGMGAICLAAAAYGLYRVWGYHPYLRPDYKEWLERTPWVQPLPLPLGPLHLVWEDAIVMVLLGLLSLRHPELTIVTPAVIVVCAYLAALAVTFLGTRQFLFGYAILFLLGLMVRLKLFPYIVAIIAVGSYLFGWVGLRRSLAGFPWAGETGILRFSDLFDSQKQQEREMGWPFEQLSPADTTVRVPVMHGLSISMLAAWWLYALAAIETDTRDRDDGLRFVCGAVAFGAIVVRILIYVWGHFPPISFRGRLVTMRWFIPGYDRIFVAPLMIAVAWRLTARAGPRWDLQYVVPVSVFVMLFVAFNAGPSLRSWRLTGTHRMVPLLAALGNRKL
jgi:hypothetical protein